MRSFLRSAVALILLVLPLRSHAEAARWFELTSRNFRIFTDTSETKGRRLLTDLESRVATFQTAFGNVPARQYPVEVLLFKQSEDFVSFAPTGAGIDTYTSAFLVKGPDRLFVVAQDKSTDDIANEVGHDLGHVFLNRIAMWHPFWLEEAAAEYFRRVGRNPDGKRVLPVDRISAVDLLTTVPSSTYKDSDPAGPFRIQSYRLLRIALDSNRAEFRAFLDALKLANGRDAKLAIDASASTELLNQFTETRLPSAAGALDIQVRDAPMDTVSLHLGDLSLAARQNLQAAKWYEGNAAELRAARAILARFASGKESFPLLERAAQAFPDHGLLQFYFGSMESPDAKVTPLQVEALERAVKLLPLVGRVHAALAHARTLTGRADEALPLLDRALALEPEYADAFYLLRSDALVALRRFDEANRAARIASSLPHSDNAASAMYSQQVASVEKRIRDLIDAAERTQVEDLFAVVQAEAQRREAPRTTPPQPPPMRAGQVDYRYEATNPVEILNPVFPDYPDILVRAGKAGKITLQVNVNESGQVISATITDSQIAELNAETISAVKKWTFKPLVRAGRPVTFSMKLIFQYSIQ